MRGRTWTESELEQAVTAARSLSDVLRRLGLRPAGGNHANIRGHIERLELDTSHFDSRAAATAGLRRRPIPLEEVLVEGSTYERGKLKRRLYAEGLKERRCELCGQGEEWRGRHMALILDHINGVADDNRLENLRIVCPNCNATLETHCGRRSRNPLADITCARCGVAFRQRRRTQRYCSQYCGTRARTSDSRPSIRRADRPPYDVLVEMIEDESYSAVGRRFGVSDNAVRKWRLAYEREAEAEAEGRPHAA